MNAPRGANQRHRSLESRLEIERLTSGLEGGCWKSAQSSNSLAAYPTCAAERAAESLAQSGEVRRKYLWAVRLT